MIKRDDIPLGYTRDANGRVLTSKDSDGFWRVHPVTPMVMSLHLRTLMGSGTSTPATPTVTCLLIRTLMGTGTSTPYDANGKVLTFKDSDVNNGELFTKIAGDDEYNLFTNEAKDYFVAGCRRFTKAEALDHWGNDR